MDKDMREQLLDVENAARNLSERIRRLTEIAPPKAAPLLREARDKAINCWTATLLARIEL
jgi:hypothetical protein